MLKAEGRGGLVYASLRLVPKLLLGNAAREAGASLALRKLELPDSGSQAPAWEPEEPEEEAQRAQRGNPKNTYFVRKLQRMEAGQIR